MRNENHEGGSNVELIPLEIEREESVLMFELPAVNGLVDNGWPWFMNDATEQRYLSDNASDMYPVVAAAVFQAVVYGTLIFLYNDGHSSKKTWAIISFVSAVLALALAFLSRRLYYHPVSLDAQSSRATVNPLNQLSGRSNLNDDITLTIVSSSAPAAHWRHAKHLERITIILLALVPLLSQLINVSSQDSYVDLIIGGENSDAVNTTGIIALPVDLFTLLMAVLVAQARSTFMWIFTVLSVVITVVKFFLAHTAAPLILNYVVSYYVIQVCSALFFIFIASRNEAESRVRFIARQAVIDNTTKIAECCEALDKVASRCLPNTEVMQPAEGKQLLAAVQLLRNVLPSHSCGAVGLALAAPAVARLKATVLAVDFGTALGVPGKEWVSNFARVASLFEMVCQRHEVPRVIGYHSVLVAVSSFTAQSNAASMFHIFTDFRYKLKQLGISADALQAVMITGIAGRGFAATPYFFRWCVVGPAVDDALKILLWDPKFRRPGALWIDHNTTNELGTLLPVTGTAVERTFTVIMLSETNAQRGTASDSSRSGAPRDEEGGSSDDRSDPQNRHVVASRPPSTSAVRSPVLPPRSTKKAEQKGYGLLSQMMLPAAEIDKPPRMERAFYNRIFECKPDRLPKLVRKYPILDEIFPTFASDANVFYRGSIADLCVRYIRHFACLAIIPIASGASLIASIGSRGSFALIMISAALCVFNIALAFLRPLKTGLSGPSWLRLLVSSSAVLAMALSTTLDPIKMLPVACGILTAYAVLLHIWALSLVTEPYRLIAHLVTGIICLFIGAFGTSQNPGIVAAMWITALVASVLLWIKQSREAVHATVLAAFVEGENSAFLTRYRHVIRMYSLSLGPDKSSTSLIADTAAYLQRFDQPHLQLSNIMYRYVGYTAVLCVHLRPLGEAQPSSPPLITTTALRSEGQASNAANYEAGQTSNAANYEAPYTIHDFDTSFLTEEEAHAAMRVVSEAWNLQIALAEAAAASEAFSISRAPLRRSVTGQPGKLAAPPSSFIILAELRGDAATFTGRIPWNAQHHEGPALAATANGVRYSRSEMEKEQYMATLITELTCAAVVLGRWFREMYRGQRISVQSAIDMGDLTSVITGRSMLQTTFAGSSIRNAEALVYHDPSGCVLLSEAAFQLSFEKSLKDDDIRGAFEYRLSSPSTSNTFNTTTQPQTAGPLRKTNEMIYSNWERIVLPQDERGRFLRIPSAPERPVSSAMI